MKNQFIRSLEYLKDSVEDHSIYPYNIECIKNLNEIEFHPHVTCVVGENGSGKSTLLEAIAVYMGLNPEGGSKNLYFSTQDTHSSLHKNIRIIKGIRLPSDSYFLRGESFYNVASHIDYLDQDPGAGAFIKESYGGKSLHEQSHGESFLSLFLHRFGDNGLYILDEPESSLSPQKQLVFLKRMHDLIQKGSQFIIATHSPIIMGYTDSKILEFQEGTISNVAYEKTLHYGIYKQFLGNKEKILNELGITDF